LKRLHDDDMNLNVILLDVRVCQIKTTIKRYKFIQQTLYI